MFSMDDRAQERLPATRRDLFSRLDALGIAHRTFEHEPLFTVAQSSKAHLEIEGAHTKNLFLKDAKDRLFLVVALHSTAVDLKRLPKLIGSARLSFGSAELLGQVLGVLPGSVTAFAVMNDVEGRTTVVIDRHLTHFDWINAHPLENTATTGVAREDLLRFIRACGHTPHIVDLDGGAKGVEATER